MHISSQEKNKKSVTIGIPLYNEEHNIGYLLDDILKQIEHNYVLKNIIISSDGSTDNSIAIVEKYADRRIKLLRNTERKGVAVRQNQIISETDTDILILFNADISIRDRNFIEKVTKPIRVDRVDTKLVGHINEGWRRQVRRIGMIDGVIFNRHFVFQIMADRKILMAGVQTRKVQYFQTTLSIPSIQIVQD